MSLTYRMCSSLFWWILICTEMHIHTHTWDCPLFVTHWLILVTLAWPMTVGLPPRLQCICFGEVLPQKAERYSVALLPAEQFAVRVWDIPVTAPGRRKKLNQCRGRGQTTLWNQIFSVLRDGGREVDQIIAPVLFIYLLLLGFCFVVWFFFFLLSSTEKQTGKWTQTPRALIVVHQQPDLQIAPGIVELTTGPPANCGCLLPCPDTVKSLFTVLRLDIKAGLGPLTVQIDSNEASWCLPVGRLWF